jgi:hypothetical protein
MQCKKKKGYYYKTWNLTLNMKLELRSQTRADVFIIQILYTNNEKDGNKYQVKLCINLTEQLWKCRCRREFI